MKGKINRAQGVISISSKGVGYVKITEPESLALSKDQDPEIAFRYLNGAMHGDRVEIILHPKGGGRQSAEVSKIISRSKTGLAGVLEKEKDVFFLKPDDTKMYMDILIPKESLNGAKAGQKVFAEIVSWVDTRKAPEGKITKILGAPGDNSAEMHAIALEKGFDSELPKNILAEAEKIKQRGIVEADFANRRDFRKVLTFTIDPFDAKDFDDAISFKDLGGDEYEIGVHIADVTHYVKTGSAIDTEARDRGTSVYLVDRTIPMLPEALSNDLCSLMPNKDRLAMSAVFVMNKNAQVKSQWFGRTVIHSQKRFTYEEAEESIKKASLPLHKELSILNKIAKKLSADRYASGAISLEQEEVKFVLDKNGVPIKVVKKVRGDSNKLVEEFMLLANRKVAETISKGLKKDGVFIYRIHDQPLKEKMRDLAFFLKSLGYNVSLRNGIIPNHEINNLLHGISGDAQGKKGLSDNIKDTIYRAVIRSMAKAIYSTKNIGHYGLSFDYYTHFTSPIRRYPDMLVHRMLNEFLAGRKIKKSELYQYEEMSRKASEREKQASDAERASIKYKQAEYMSSRIGEQFNGIISGVSEWGIYVEEVETKCEGMIRSRDITDDFYVFNEKNIELVGQKKKKRYRLGDKIKMKVKNVDLERKTIDYALV